MIKAHPVGVDQGVHASQGIAQLVRLIEVKREGANFLPKGIHTMHRVRQGDDLVTDLKEARGNIAPRVTECSCNCDTHSALCRTASISGGSQPPMTFDLSLSESAGSRSLHRLVERSRCAGWTI